jgi:hypothetical protein
MTERKFTPPTTFPAEYVTRDGKKAVIVARTPDERHPLIGWVEGKKDNSFNCFWADNGGFHKDGREIARDLFDIVLEPQKHVHWKNDYGICGVGFWHDTREKADKCASDNRIAVIRREWVAGQPPQYFTEEVQ